MSLLQSSYVLRLQALGPLLHLELHGLPLLEATEALRLDGEGVAEQRAAMFQNLTAQYNTLVQAGMPSETAEKILIKMMELDTLRDVAKNGNVIVTTTADKDPITNTQAAFKAAEKTQPAPKP